MFAADDAHVSVVHAHAGDDDVLVLPDLIDDARGEAGGEAIDRQPTDLSPCVRIAETWQYHSHGTWATIHVVVVSSFWKGCNHLTTHA